MFTFSHKPDGSAETAEVTAAEYQSIRLFLSENCGIVLGDGKDYLLRSRLSPVLNKFQLSSYSALITALQSTTPFVENLKSEVIDAMTTNETFWFRDDKQFIELREKVLPQLLLQKNTHIKIWSAACSTGQEPYSISISALEARRAVNKTKPVQIIATDISARVLLEAQAAVYSELALSRGIDLANKARYFQKHHHGYKLVPEVTQTVRFQQFNLLKPFQVLGRFDIIFCRNVLIYFSDPIKRDILTRMADRLEPHGYLFLSSTEAMPVDLKLFEPVKDGLTSYFKKTA